MSEKQNPLKPTKRSQRQLSKKNSGGIIENGNEAIPQCSKSKETEDKKSSKKPKPSVKNQPKEKYDFPKAKIHAKRSKEKRIEYESKEDCKKDSKKMVVQIPSVAKMLAECLEAKLRINENSEQNLKGATHRAKKKSKSQSKLMQDFEDQSAGEILGEPESNESESPEKIEEEVSLSPQKTQKSPKKQETFADHISIKEIDELLKNQNSLDAEYVEGYLRINPKFYKHAYLSMQDNKRDLLIVGLKDRNRAFEADFVVARINPPDLWQSLSSGEKQRTGVVVCIREKVHPRKAIGQFKQQGTSVFLYPRDKRVPLVKVHPEYLPRGLLTQPSLYEDTLFLVAITNWNKPQFAVGRIVKMVGTVGDVKVESKAILLEHDLDVTPYNQKILKDLPGSDYQLTAEDFEGREDWRNECVFTIDPDTAVDLDDAVSCRVLENGNYEIGVHISDVTHYLEFLSPLDIQVSKRATTVYMTDNVYHMLPKQLCQLCSLLPGQDKLTFSVVWEMTEDSKIMNQRFAKSVINSCCQMAYQQAQKFIENPNNDWPDDFLKVNGNFTISDLEKKVNILHGLATQMRSRRFEEGALRIDQPKLHVVIDKITGYPVSYTVEEQKDSNRLIEEFMLLANMTVASHLYNKIPESALLRNHREPSKLILSDTKELLQKFGIHLDIESAGSLHSSIKRYEELESEFCGTDDTVKYRMMVINNLCSKAMARATYRCSSTVKTQEELRHYALNASLYTHFTSPIRRYPDCVVHRLLYATMANESLPKEWSEKLCMKIAANCNLRKYNAKQAQEQSSVLYFTYLIDLRGPFVTLGIAMDVKEQSIDVMLCQVGIKLRIHLTELENIAAVEYSTECLVPTISICWTQPEVTQVINVLTLLYLRIEKHPEIFRLNAVLLPPSPRNGIMKKKTKKAKAKN